jgi:hypothetical protein
MTDVEHISRKGTGVPISWFPIPEESELPDDLQGLFTVPRGSPPGSPTTASSTSRPRTWTRRRGR